MRHEEITNEVIAKLKNAGFVVDGYSVSESDFGVSHYVIAFDNNNNSYKFRISDHSTENIHRMFNEYHINTTPLGISLIDSRIEKAEKIAFPEKFDIIYTGEVITGIKVRKYIRK